MVVQERFLRGVRVVIVAPKHASNVGAVARACDNFEVWRTHSYRYLRTPELYGMREMPKGYLLGGLEGGSVQSWAML